MHKDRIRNQLYNLTLEDSLLAKIHSLRYEEARKSEALTQEMLTLWYGCNKEGREKILKIAKQLIERD